MPAGTIPSELYTSKDARAKGLVAGCRAIRAVSAIALSLFVVAGFGAAAQSSAGPKFDAVEIRASKPIEDGAEIMYTTNQQHKLVQIRVLGKNVQVTPVFGRNGRVIMEQATLRQLISTAYKEILRDEYLTGGPRWLDSEHFDLVAKAPPDTPIDTQRIMIQAVLAERFHLQVHRENRPMPVYALVVGKSGPKLHRAEGSNDSQACVPVRDSSQGGMHRDCHNVTMAMLAEWLPQMAQSQLDLPVVDLTGLGGAYDFQLDWTPLPPDGDQTIGSTIFTAVEKELGLKLEQRKHPMPTVVIDHVERIPE